MHKQTCEFGDDKFAKEGAVFFGRDEEWKTKSGFTDALKKKGDKGEVKLITLEDMYR